MKSDVRQHFLTFLLKPAIRTFFINILLFLVIFVGVLQLPSRVSIDDHDAGSQAAYEYWTLHGLQYGVDIEQNVGPLGFLNYPSLYTGLLDTEKLILNLFLTALLAVLAVFTGSNIPGRLNRWLFYSAITLFCTPPYHNSYVTADVQCYVLMLLIAYSLIRLTNLYLIAILVSSLTLLSLGKGSQLFIALAIISVTSIHHLAHKRAPRAVLVLAGYGFSFISFWMACGQKLVNIPAFFFATVSFSSGYNDALVGGDNPAPLEIALLSLQFAIISIAINIMFSIKYKRPFLTADVVSKAGFIFIQIFILFITWKHGFVHGDTFHNAIFFQFLIIAAIPCVWLPSSTRSLPTSFPSMRKVLSRAWFCQREALCIVLLYYSLLGLQHCDPSRRSWNYIKEFSYTEFPHKVDVLFNIHSQMQLMDAQLQKSITAMHLPLIDAVVRRQDISYFGLKPGAMVYNNFKYRPTPATVSVAGFNHHIMAKDAAFFREDTLAPLYVIYKVPAFSFGHLTAQDDSLAQLEILRHYDPKLLEKNRILLKRRKMFPANVIHEPIGVAKTYLINTWIDVPANISDPLRVKIVLPPKSLQLLLTSLLYRDNQYALEFIVNDQFNRTGFVPQMAEDGFLVAPLISSNDSLLAAYSHQEYAKYIANQSTILGRITSLRVVCISEFKVCPEEMKVSFEMVHGLELGRIDQ